MEIDWAQALQIGSIGFGLVFAILFILAVVTWLASFIINRNVSSDDETATQKEE
jgi:Na+-transporting methylmalonyl-CoA/oxaloacetate decarboxylase gamma subunit